MNVSYGQMVSVINFFRGITPGQVVFWCFLLGTILLLLSINYVILSYSGHHIGAMLIATGITILRWDGNYITALITWLIAALVIEVVSFYIAGVIGRARLRKAMRDNDTLRYEYLEKLMLRKFRGGRY